MNHILAFLISLAPLVIWNKIRVLLTPEGADAAINGGGTGVNATVMRFLALRLEAIHIDESQYIAVSFVMGLFFAFGGYFSDAMMNERGFGPKGNCGLLFLGAALSVTGWVLLAPSDYLSVGSVIVLMAAVGAALMLMAGALIKQFILTRMDNIGGPSSSTESRRNDRLSRINLATNRHRH